MTAISPLRQALDDAITAEGGSLKAYTVLAPQNDPFRVDTPARHRDGAWLAITARDLGLGDRRIHLRGLHYMVIGRPRPASTAYANTDPDWLWLSGDAGKAARYLGYLPFDQIVDQRNADPVVRVAERADPWPYLSARVDVDIPDADDLTLQPWLSGFVGLQPNKIVLVGEKSSLDDALAPVAAAYHADLYLPTGEMSDTMAYRMAQTAAADGRPMVVLYFADCDPAGWQMPVSVGRKLQAFKASLFPNLEFEVHRVGLTPDQVREYGLPSTPLKDTEKRADRWQAAMGVQQTEIDALAALRPDLLRRIARDAVEPFYDHTLARRVNEARNQWLAEGETVVDAMTPEAVDRVRVAAVGKLDELRAEIDALNNPLRVAADGIELPPAPPVPAAELNGRGVHGLPLLDSKWSFAEQCRALIASKAYAE